MQRVCQKLVLFAQLEGVVLRQELLGLSLGLRLVHIIVLCVLSEPSVLLMLISIR